jgi:hypothetical protein
MATPTGGIKRFSVDGVALDVAEVGSFSIAKEKRSSVEVAAGNPGSNVVPAIPHVEVVILTRGIRISDYVAQEGVTAQLDLANGTSFVWSDATEVGDGEVNPADGKLSLRYESADAKEL